jgi:hypothetical protein
MMIHHAATPIMAPAAFPSSKVGHAHWHAGAARKPVVRPNPNGTYIERTLLGFGSSVIRFIGNYI